MWSLHQEVRSAVLASGRRQSHTRARAGFVRLRSDMCSRGLSLALVLVMGRRGMSGALPRCNHLAGCLGFVSGTANDQVVEDHNNPCMWIGRICGPAAG